MFNMLVIPNQFEVFMDIPPFSPVFSPIFSSKPVPALRLPPAPPGRRVAIGAPAVPRAPGNGEEDTNPTWHAWFQLWRHGYGWLVRLDEN